MQTTGANKKAGEYPGHNRQAKPPSKLNPTAHKPSRTLQTRRLDAQCTCHTHSSGAGDSPLRRKSALGHTMAQLPDVIRSIVPYGTNKRRQPKQGGRAGATNNKKTNQPKTLAARQSCKLTHGAVEDGSCANAQPTPARPDQPYRTQT